MVGTTDLYSYTAIQRARIQPRYTVYSLYTIQPYTPLWYIQFSGVREKKNKKILRTELYHLCLSSVDQTLKSKAPFLHTLFPGGYSILGGYSTGPLMYPSGWVAA